MSDVNDNSSGSKDDRKTSGATKRIVVQDLPPEEKPRVQGRRLETPSDLDRTSRRFDAPDNYLATPPPSNPRVPLRGRAPGLSQHAQPAPAIKKTKTKEPINVKRLVLFLVGIIALPVVIGGVMLVLSAARKKGKRQAQPSVVTRGTGQMTTTDASAPSPVPSATVQETQAVTTTVTVESAEIRSMSMQLATQISQKQGYEFAPELVELIRARSQEYSSATALIGARQFRREINKSFRDQGLNPIVGYAIAMSRSKFDPAVTEKGIGVWQIPLSVARSQGYVGLNDSGAKLKVPETSAQISASYTKQLLSTFDADDFMYAIACFGMNLEEAGRLQARLVTAAPDSRNRRDIMKMIRAGVLTADQVDNMARFFAAGIVGENPQKFGLTDSQSFSSLY